MRVPAANPLITRADVRSAFLALEAPLLAAWRDDSTGPEVGFYRARYGINVTRLETFSRYLWGLVPFTAGGGESRGWTLVLDALSHGTDPQHPDFWGDAGNTDQRSVEMAAIGVALRLVPHKIWEPLGREQKDRLATWLGKMVDKQLVPSNWQFFRLLVTLGLRHIGRHPANTDAMEQKAIDVIDSLYLGDGWYWDGGRDQRDYYIPWAFHFYSLLCARLCEQGPVVKRLEAWKQRAQEFGRQFAFWFSGDGAALPFGRSLTYRFAQAAYWAGCGIASLPGLTPGQQRGLWLRNLRWWWKQPMLNPDGVLSLGYAYPNINMLEPYNAAGSVYWACKAFAPLLLTEDDPFWRDKEQPLPAAPARDVQKHARMVIDRDPDSGHVLAVSAGQWHTWPLRHRDAKYAKFAYSTYFGPCVGPNHEWLAGVGIDNTLSIVAADKVPEDGALWQNRGLTTNHRIEDEHLVSEWTSMPGVAVRSWLVPLGAWHVRVHRVVNEHVIQLAEGAFAAEDPISHARTDNSVCLRGRNGGLTGIIDVTGTRAASSNDTEPNSSLYHSRVRIPMLLGRFEPGTHWLATVVLGATPGSRAAWETPPQVQLEPGQRVTVAHGRERITITLAD